MPSRNILLVEDDADANRFYRLSLEAEGFRVDSADSGPAALEALQQNAYDLVLLDIMMEGLDGIETCRKLREELGLTALPVCMITASMDVEKVVSAFDAGANGYIVKPFDIDELLNKINELVAA